MIGKTIYDISEDEMRAATQEDVDNYAKAIMTGQFMVMVLRRLLPVVVPPPGPAFADQLRHNFKTWLRQQGENVP